MTRSGNLEIFGNIRKIAEDCDTNVDHLTKNLVKNNMTFSQISNEQKWRIPILNELLDRRFNETYIAGFSDIELTELINFLCTDLMLYILSSNYFHTYIFLRKHLVIVPCNVVIIFLCTKINYNNNNNNIML